MPSVHLQMECLLMRFFSLFYITGMHSRCFTYRREIVRNPESTKRIGTPFAAKLSLTLRKEERRSEHEQSEQKRITRLREKVNGKRARRDGDENATISVQSTEKENAIFATSM